MNSQQWLTSGQFCQLDQHQLFYRFEPKANAPTLLLIHGFPTASWDWHKVWPALSAHFQLLCFDMLGFGYSDKPPKHTYSTFNQVDLLEQLLKQLNINECHILAHDYGDTNVQELLARQSQQANLHIHSIVLLNGGLFPGVYRPLFIQKLLMSPIGYWVAQRISYRAFKRNFDKICYQPIAEQELQQLWQLVNHNQGKAVFHKLIRYMKERILHQERWVSALQQAPLPMLFINGSADPISGKHMEQAYRDLISNPQVVPLATVGHYPQLEAPSEVTEAALAFWRSSALL